MPTGDLDAELGGLLDVASPQLVHAGQYVVRRPAGERELEDELRLASGEAVVGAVLAPPRGRSSRRSRRAVVVDPRRLNLAEACGLHRRRWPP